MKFFYKEIGHLIFLEAEHLCFVETPVPLSAISFCSVSLHKKDTAAIGARLQSSLLRCKRKQQCQKTEIDSQLDELALAIR